MNLSDLKRAAEHADTIEGNPRTRLTDVHLRIRTARRRRAAAVAGAVVVAIGFGGMAVNGAWQAAQVHPPAGSTSAPPSALDTEGSWCTASTAAPAAGRIGYMGLPPVGAVPSRATPAELVLEWFGPDGHGNGNVWLFDDGRLIVEREKDLPQGATDRQTGYLERCLSPAGVDSLRRYVVQEGRLPTEPSRDAWLRVRAVDGGPLIDLDHASIDSDRLFEPESWLPDSGWVDRRYQPYVPTTYSFCGDRSGTPSAPPAELGRIPRRAADFLRPLPWTMFPTRFGDHMCATFPTEQARDLVRIFDQEWFRPDYRGEPAVLDVGLIWRETSTVTESNRMAALVVGIEPVLPDGQFTCNC